MESQYLLVKYCACVEHLHPVSLLLWLHSDLLFATLEFGQFAKEQNHTHLLGENTK